MLMLYVRNLNASGETERSKKNAKLEIQIERVRKSNSECEEREIRDLTVAISPATVTSFFEGSLYGLEAGGSCSSGDLNQDKDDSNTESGNASILSSRMALQHFSHPQHPLVFNANERSGISCQGCWEPVWGPSYSCITCKNSYHHKSCAELPLELHHPLHPNHPLILQPITLGDEEYNKCIDCNEFRFQYIYHCSDCNFSIHSGCSSFPLTTKSAVHKDHDHSLTRIWKLMKFTCDFCGKEGNLPFLCVPCNFGIHTSCAACLPTVEVTRHKHPLQLTHSSETHQSNSRICLLCVEKVDTHWVYYCSICDFIAHLRCSMNPRNKAYKKLEELVEEQLHLSVVSTTYEVKKFTMGEDGAKIATEIKHFSHKHDLQLTDEVPNNIKCNGLISDTLTHACHEHRLYLSNTNTKQECSSCGEYRYRVFRCATCEFVLDFRCAALPQTAWYNQHEHPFTLYCKPEDDSGEYYCDICEEERDPKQWFYYCADCNFPAHLECILGEEPNVK
uniref:DC1 domain-containing protein n=1 Tax=Quercus lobata TaxID=97700 RepID=A0A7N2M1F9_QUELO